MKYILENPLCLITGACLSLCSQALTAATFPLNDNTNILGAVGAVKIDSDDTLLDIGKTHGFGLQEIKLANPGVDTWLPGEGREIILPSEFVLPNAPRTGIVLNIPEMRLYFFPESKDKKNQQVITYPLGIGREGWSTPYVKTMIVQKKEKPSWYPPESIRKEHEEAGDPLPKVVPPGPDNPMGEYALKLGFDAYSIHGTNKAFGMGMRVSHGCIRLYPDDIADLYQKVKLKTPVNIVNQPFKVGMRDGVIYLEAHPYLEEDREYFSRNSITLVVKNIIEMTDATRASIDWALVRKVMAETTGIPVAIGRENPATAIEVSAEPEKISTATDNASITLTKTRPATKTSP